MSDNDKHEEKWTLNFRDDQCNLIVAAMNYVAARCDERIGNSKFMAFDQCTSEAVKLRALEIAEQISSVTT